MRILAVSAHPDDCELGAAGLIQRADERRILVLSHGERGGEAVQRLNEQAEAAKILRASCLVRGLPDTRISLAEAVDAIEAEVAEYKPDVVLTLASTDTHQDHQTAHRAALVAVRNRPCTVLGYVSPSSAAQFRPNWFVPLTESEMAVKLAAIACHHSQSARAYMTPESVAGMARYWAMVTRSHAQYVEPFECVRHVEGLS